MLISPDGLICEICKIGGTDTTELESKLLTRSAIGAIILAASGMFLAFHIGDINIFVVLSAPFALKVAMRILRVARQDKDQLNVILSLVAIVVAIASLLRWFVLPWFW